MQLTKFGKFIGHQLSTLLRPNVRDMLARSIAPIIEGLERRTLMTATPTAVGFQAASVIPVIAGANLMVTADFNGDGHMDIAYVDSGARIAVMLGKGDGSYLPKAGFFQGTQTPTSLIVGDFNGDGHLDLGVVGGDLSTFVPVIHVLPGNGDGTFQAPNTFPEPATTSLGAGYNIVTAADVNHDGRTDILASNSTAGTVAVLTSNGDGTFLPGAIFSTGVGAGAVTAGDFNNDGLSDFAVSDTSAGGGTLTLSILLGNADGTLHRAGPNPILPGSAVATIVAGDINGDGFTDLVTTGNSGVINLWLGNGDGTFQPPTVIASQFQARSVIIANVDGDTLPDVLEITNNGIVGFFSGNGDGTFAPELDYTDEAGSFVTFQDVNSDGLGDLVGLDAKTWTIDTILGNGAGGFQTPIVYAQNSVPNLVAGQTLTPPNKAKFFGDFNGDGIPDFATANTALNTVSVSLGNADGTFKTPLVFNPEHIGTQPRPAIISIGDFNGDHLDDMIIYNPGLVATGGGGGGGRGGGGHGGGSPGTYDTWTLYLSNGDGTFTPNTISLAFVTPSPAVMTQSVDLNGDGVQDQIFAFDTGVGPPNATVGFVKVFITNAASTFPITTSEQTFQVGGKTNSMTVTDLNGDGHPDIVVASGDSSDVYVLINNGDGTFKSVMVQPPNTSGTVILPAPVPGGVPYSAYTLGPGEPANANGTFGLQVADFNLDGKPDLAVATAIGQISILLGNGDGTFQSGYVFDIGGSPKVLAVNDFNGDGFPDVAAPIGTSVAVALNAGIPEPLGTAVGLNVSAGPVAAGQPASVTVTAVDALGNTATGFLGTVHFTGSSDPAATLPTGFYTFTATDAGVHTFTTGAVFTQAGADQVSVNNPALGTSASTITVTSAAAASFAVSASASSVIAGAPFTFTVNAMDRFGNLATGYAGTVQLLSSDPQAGLPTAYTFTAADAGAHTFSISLKTAGAQSISIVDTANSTLNAGVSAIAVTPADAASFSITGLSPLPTGAAQTITVMARDAFGNPSPGYLGTVNFTSSDARATLPAAYTFTAADAGVHTFTATLNTAGMQSITVTDSVNTSLTGTTSSLISSLPAAIAITGFPSTIIAGVQQAFTITVIDAVGNIATGYTGTIAVTTSDDANTNLFIPFVPSMGGTFTLSFILRHAGVQSISATSRTGALISGMQSGIVVTASPQIGSFLVDASSGIRPGTAQTLTVSAEDPFGNFNPTYTGTVKFSSTDALAGLPANYKFTAADAGKHSFAVTLDTPGLQSVSVTDLVVFATGLANVLVAPSAANLSGEITTSVPFGTYDVAFGDFNGDGHPDVILSNPNSNSLSIMLGNADGTYQSETDFASLTGATAIVAGDFNGDGHLDVAALGAAASAPHAILVYFGNGDGAFQPLSGVTPIDPGYGHPGGALAENTFTLGDVNHDGRVDILLDNSAAGMTEVYLDNGDGTFQPGVAYATGAGTLTIALADFNHDGNLDLVASSADPANPASRTINILNGNGDGTFAPAVPLTYNEPANQIFFSPLRSIPDQLSVADLNNDGNPDLITVGSNDAMVRFWLGNGDGTFRQTSFFGNIPGAPVTRIVATDLNGDHIPDLVEIANAGFTNVLLGSVVNGNLTYSNPWTYEDKAMLYPTAFDANGDGKNDFIDFDFSATPALYTFPGNGDGTLQAPDIYSGFNANVPVLDTNFVAPPQKFVADFNHDRIPDYATSNAAADTVSIYLGNADGTYQAPLSFVPQNLHTLPLPQIIGITDLTGNFGKTNLEIYNPGIPSATGGTFGTVTLYVNNGDGTFTMCPFGFAPLIPPAQTLPASPNIGDFNGDGIPDLIQATVTGSFTTWTVTLVGTNLPPQSYVMPGGSSDPPVVADLNDDGRPDILLSSNNSGNIYVLINKGDGTFKSTPIVGPLGALVAGAIPTSVYTLSNQLLASQSTLGSTQQIQVADFNQDGIPDVAVQVGTIEGFGGEDILLGNGDGTFQAGQSWITGQVQPFMSTTFADVNGDGFLDAFTQVANGVGTVVLNKFRQPAGTAVGLRITAAPSAVAGQATSVTVTAVDAQGNPATNYVGSVRFAGSSDPTASLPGGIYTFTAADAGTHTFSGLIFHKAASDTVSVRDLRLGLATATVQVTPGAAALFAVSAPALATAGTPTTVIVTTTDAFGNPVSVYSGTVHFSSNDLLASLPADFTFTPADGGTHAFSAVLTLAGNQTITATDTSNASIHGSGIVTVAAGAASRLVLATSFANPSAAGTPGTITIVAKDVYGNIATNFNGTALLAASDPQAVLPASAVFVNGTATATGVIFKTAGTTTVTATVAGNTTITGSTTLAVVQGPVAALAINTPASTIAGTAVNVTVTARDMFGNLIPGYTGTVHFVSSDRQGTMPADYTFTAGDAGVHTFNLVFKTAGTKSFNVADTTIASAQGQASIVVAPAAPALFLVSGFPLTIAGVSNTFTVIARDAFGNVARNYTGTITFTSSDPQAALPAAYIFTATDAGSHTFTAALKTAGVQSITTTDSTNSAATGAQQNILVTPAALSTLSVTAPRTPAIAGTAQTFTVMATDAYGNVITNYGGTVSFSSSDTLAGLPANYTFTTVPTTTVSKGITTTTPADGGIHTFTATLKTAGTQTLTATDNVNAALTGTGSIVVTGAAAASFTISGFPATVAGVAQTFTVTTRDAYGNIAGGYTGTVAFTSSDAQAGLPASYTFTAADAGTHSFTATLKTAGTQSITAKDVSATTLSGSQTGIVVSASNIAGAFVVSGFPATSAGAAHTFAVTVKDAFGNFCTGYTGTVVFRSSDVQAGLPATYTFTSADAGSHTFSATLFTAGSQSLTVKDATTPNIAGSQTGIAVTAGIGVRLAISAPSGATAGKSFTVVVTAYDAWGNIATGYRGKVHFTDPVSAGLPSDYSFSTGDNGVHSFSITLATVATHVLTVTDANSAMKISATIVVSNPVSGGHT